MSSSVQEATAKKAADKIDAYLQGKELKESEDERLETLIEKIKVYSKEEKIGDPGGQKRADAGDSSSGFEKVDL